MPDSPHLSLVPERFQHAVPGAPSVDVQPGFARAHITLQNFDAVRGPFA